MEYEGAAQGVCTEGGEGWDVGRVLRTGEKWDLKTAEIHQGQTTRPGRPGKALILVPTAMRIIGGC